MDQGMLDSRQSEWLDKIAGTSLSGNFEPNPALANIDEEIRHALPSRDFGALDDWMSSPAGGGELYDASSENLGIVDPALIGTVSDEQVEAALLGVHFPASEGLSGRENEVIQQAESIVDTLVSKSPTFRNVLVAATQGGAKPLTVRVGGAAGPTASYTRLTNTVNIRRNSLRQGADLVAGHIVFEMINAARIPAALRVGRMAMTGYYEKLAQTLSSSDKPVSAANLYAAALETAEYPGIVAHHGIFQEAKDAGTEINVSADIYAANFNPEFGANYASLHEYLSLQLTTGHTARYANYYIKSVLPRLLAAAPGAKNVSVGQRDAEPSDRAVAAEPATETRESTHNRDTAPQQREPVTSEQSEVPHEH